MHTSLRLSIWYLLLIFFTNTLFSQSNVQGLTNNEQERGPSPNKIQSVCDDINAAADFAHRLDCDVIYLEPIISPEPDFVSWEIDDDQIVYGRNISHRFVEPGLHEVCVSATVKISQNEACEVKVCKDIKFVPNGAITVPNVFTPNFDGINDEFGVQSTCRDMNDFYMLIFNRWGQVLYKSNDVFGRWDGTFQGKSMPVGTYYWSIRYKGVRGGAAGFLYLEGPITLLR